MATFKSSMVALALLMISSNSSLLVCAVSRAAFAFAMATTYSPLFNSEVLLTSSSYLASSSTTLSLAA